MVSQRHLGDDPRAHALAGLLLSYAQLDQEHPHKAVDAWIVAGQDLARVFAPQSLPSSVEPLSRTEAQVLLMMGQGYDINGIARVRSVSVNTVKTHVRGIYRKLGVSSRYEAVRQGAMLGYLLPPSMHDVDSHVPSTAESARFDTATSVATASSVIERSGFSDNGVSH